ncbi:MAG: succinylglutamate desuccinylase/aspartoacylase family protein [Betaproteobacteria bacterium]
MAVQQPANAAPPPEVQVDFPDLSPWAAGNTGVPYLWTFDSGRPGPHVGLQALTHGNEVCGAIALDLFLREGLRPLRGRLSLCFANVAAHRTWEPGEPYKSRFVDEDFNRVWDDSVLDGTRDTTELRRARELRPFYDTVEYLLDIHSMSDPCPPLMLAGVQKKGIDLALALGIPEYVIVDAGHAAGRRLRDYAFFDVPGDPRTALLVECGQHWARESPRLAVQIALRMLRQFELILPEFLDRHLDSRPTPPQRVIEVTASIAIGTDAFRFIWPQDGTLTLVGNAGSLIALDGDREIRTPYDQCALVMPMRRPAKRGDTAVRLGRLVS